MKNTFAVIGGVAAGTAAAARLKRLQPDAEVILFEKSAHISYRICEFPYFLRASDTEATDLHVFTPESFQKEKGVKVISGAEVIHIHPQKKELTWRNVTTRMVYTMPFHAVLLATGGEARLHPPIEAQNHFTLRRPEELERARVFIKENKPRRAIITGGGAIGIELAESLKQSGMEVVLLEQASTLLSGRIPADFSGPLTNHLQKSGIQVMTGVTISDGIVDGNTLKSLIGINGERLSGDIFFSAAGVKPSAIISGLETIRTTNGFYIVNNWMETNIRGIFAAGDGAVVKTYRKDSPDYNFLATRAHFMGRLAAESMAGIENSGAFPVFPFALSAWNFEIGSVGSVIPDPETEVAVIVATKDYPPLHPSPHPFRLCLIANRSTGHITGCAVFGPPSSTSVLNVLSLAIQQKLNLDAIEKMGMVYHPGISTLVHPLQQAARLLIKKVKRNRHHL